jgi:hypothetical protein
MPLPPPCKHLKHVFSEKIGVFSPNLPKNIIKFFTNTYFFMPYLKKGVLK